MSDSTNIYGDEVEAFSSRARREDLTSGGDFRKHVLVCTNKAPDGCQSKGGFEVKKRFYKEVYGHELDDIKVSSVGPMGYCERGPIAVIYPDNVWYSELSVNEVPLIVEEHLIEEQPVEELTFDPELPEDFDHFVICTFMASCANECGGEVYRSLLKKARNDEKTKVTHSMGCLKECSMGPVCCVYPDGYWYTGIHSEQATDIFNSHVIENKPAKFATGRLK